MLAHSTADCLQFDDAVKIINKGYYENKDRDLLKKTCRDDVPYAMVVAVKDTGNFYQFFTDAVSEHYPDLHMYALSLQNTVIEYIPENLLTRDMALKAVTGWGYAYSYLSDDLKRDPEIIFRTLQHGKDRLDTVMEYHPDKDKDGFNYQAALNNKQNCEISLILFADRQDITRKAVDKLRAYHQKLGCFSSDN